MGKVFSKSLDLKVGTLNYSGIVKSPYQFFLQESKEQVDLSLRFILYYSIEKQPEKYSLQNFEQQIKKMQQKRKQNNDFIQQARSRLIKYKIKNLSSIDKDWQIKRYSPLYSWNIGVRDNKFLQNQKEFLEQWDQHYETNKQDLLISFKNYARKKIKQQKAKNEEYEKLQKKYKALLKNVENDIQIICLHLLTGKQIVGHSKNLQQISWKNWQEVYQQDIIKQLRTFDLIAFKAIISNIYKSQFTKDQSNNLKQINLTANKYIYNRLKKFECVFLDEQTKKSKTVSFFRNSQLDIMFLQQATKPLMKQFQKQLSNVRLVYPITSSPQEAFTAIVIKEDKFPPIGDLRTANKIFFNNIVDLQGGEQKIKSFMRKQQNQDMQSYKSHTYWRDYNINSKTVIQAIGNLILVGVHLKSKKGKENDNQKQNQQLKIKLNELQRKMSWAYIICGGDLNGEYFYNDEDNIENQNYDQIQRSDLQQSMTNNQLQKSQTPSKIVPSQFRKQNIRHLNIFPTQTNQKQQKYITTSKKRSYLQAQPDKADLMINQVKDYLITSQNLKLTKGEIKFIQGKYNRSHSYCLPLNQHPFDHFLVTATITIPQPIMHIRSTQYIQKFEPSKLTSEHLQQIYKRQFM